MGLTRDEQETLGNVEWDYTHGQSFTVDEDALIQWMLLNGWAILPPMDHQARVWREEWNDA